MRKATSISINILDKTDKNETVSMDTLARIATAMKYVLFNIVEITIIEKDCQKY